MGFNLPNSARKAVQRAVARGALQKEPCANCGALKVQAHHRDYARPLDVIWLCVPCHRKAEPKRPSYATIPPPRNYGGKRPPPRPAVAPSED